MEAPSEPGFAHLSRVQLAPGGPGLWGGVKHAQPRAWLVLRHLSSAGPLGGACEVQRGGALCSPLECGLASRLASNQKTMTKVTCVPSTVGYKRWWLPVCQDSPHCLWLAGFGGVGCRGWGVRGQGAGFADPQCAGNGAPPTPPSEPGSQPSPARAFRCDRQPWAVLAAPRPLETGKQKALLSGSRFLTP